MGFRKSFIVLAAICLTCGVCIFALSGYTTDPTAEETKRREAEIYAENLQKHIPIVFYGKVVDLENQPVKDVDILLSVRTMFGDKAIQCKTDENGLFTVNSRGEMLSVGNISKDIYEYTIKRNPERSFEYSTIGGVYHVPDPAKPVVFYLRKRNHPNYMKGSNIKFEIDGYSTYERQEHLIFQGYYTPEGKEGILPDGETTNSFDSEDYQIQGQLSEDGKNYIITINTLRGNSGCIAGDQLLYEAPAEGYRPSVSFPVDISETDDQYKYVCMKTNDGQFYSILSFKFVCRNFNLPDERYMYVYVNANTNVEGTRGLEHDDLYNLLEGNWRHDLYDLRCCQEVTEREFMEHRGLKKLPWKATKFSNEINEEVFMQEMQKEKELRKKEDPHWWHLLE